ncbi:MAG: metallophosphoesterase [Chitinophagales bacterium]|nr:metallophosphoesterase [Chitinophagales bacterium]
MQLNRRDFLKKSGTAAGLLLASQFPFEAFAHGDVKKLTILHTNDQHSRIEPFPMDGSRFQGLGGFANRAAVINKIRSQEKNVLLLDSGDIWQGTPYFNLFNGSLEFKLMSEMRYDASTLGNHDFDNGLEALAKQMPLANFPFLCANYNFSNTVLAKKTQPYKIFKIDGIDVGVFGIGIELDGLVTKPNYGETIYEDPIKTANRIAARLKNDYKCDLVVCLSHLGYKYKEKKVSDLTLAYNSRNIDLILGGHTHTLMPKPDELTNADGKKVLVNQVGWAGIALGRVEYYFEPKKKGIVVANAPVKIGT